MRKALRSYLSDLRAEIVDTDNPEYKRELREERETLEAALGKLDSGESGGAQGTVRVVELWWSAEA